MTLIIYKDEKFYSDRKIKINDIAVDMYKPIIVDGMLLVAFGLLEDRSAATEDLIKQLVVLDKERNKLSINKNFSTPDYLKSASSILIYLNLKYEESVYKFLLCIANDGLRVLDRSYPKVIGVNACLVSAFILDEEPLDLFEEMYEYSTCIGEDVDITETSEIPLLVVNDDFFTKDVLGS